MWPWGANTVAMSRTQEHDDLELERATALILDAFEGTVELEPERSAA